MKNLILWSAILIGCGGSSTKSVCGNNIREPGEECDMGMLNGTAGNGCSSACTLINVQHTGLQVTWFINHNVVPGYDSEPCFTVVDQAGGYSGFVRITLSGPVTYTDEYACSPNVFLYMDQAAKPLPPGQYTVTARLIQRQMAAPMAQMDLTQDVTEMATVTDMHQTDAVVNFPWDKFLDQNRSGNLFFQTTGWRPMDPPDAGADAGLPPLMGCQGGGVAKVKFFLQRMGTQVTPPPVTSNFGGVHLNGMTADCHTPAGPTDSYKVDTLPWGPYEMVVGGYADQNATQLLFCSSTPVFVGAGSANPPFKLYPDATTATSCP